MAHANPVGGATVYIDENVPTPEDTFGVDAWPTTIRFVGPGLIVELIDEDV